MPKIDVRPESFVFSQPIRVLWGDMDAFGHVNHARYLSYFEHARGEYWAERGVPIRMGNLGPVMAHAQVRYRAQVAFPATVRVYLRPTAVHRMAFRMEYAVYNEDTGELTADGETLMVWVDFDTGRRAELPQSWRDILQPGS